MHIERQLVYSTIRKRPILNAVELSTHRLRQLYSASPIQNEVIFGCVEKEIHKLFFDLRDKFGQTIIIVTHDRDLASMSDRILEMKDGEFLV